jgi:hypothetical protein
MFMNKAALQSQMCNSKSLVEVGFADLVVPEDQLMPTVDKVVEGLKQLPLKQYGVNKLALRADTIADLKQRLAGLQKEYFPAE